MLDKKNIEFSALLTDLEDILADTRVGKLIRDGKIKDEARLIKVLTECLGSFTAQQATIARVVLKTLANKS